MIYVWEKLPFPRYSVSVPGVFITGKSITNMNYSRTMKIFAIVSWHAYWDQVKLIDEKRRRKILLHCPLNNKRGRTRYGSRILYSSVRSRVYVQLYIYCIWKIWNLRSWNWVFYTWQKLEVHPNCSGVRSDLHILGVWAFFTKIGTKCFLFSWSHKYPNLQFFMYIQLYLILYVFHKQNIFPSLFRPAEKTRETLWKRAFPEQWGDRVLP